MFAYSSLQQQVREKVSPSDIKIIRAFWGPQTLEVVELDKGSGCPRICPKLPESAFYPPTPQGRSITGAPPLPTGEPQVVLA